MKLKTYTVVGFYSDNDQRFGTSVRAKDPDDAESRVLKEIAADEDNSGQLHICAVFEGDIQCVDTDGYLNPPLP